MSMQDRFDYFFRGVLIVVVGGGGGDRWGLYLFCPGWAKKRGGELSRLVREKVKR